MRLEPLVGPLGQRLGMMPARVHSAKWVVAYEEGGVVGSNPRLLGLEHLL